MSITMAVMIDPACQPTAPSRLTPRWNQGRASRLIPRWTRLQLDNRHPFTLFCRSISDASRFARLDDPAFRLLRRLSPGPVTFILPASGQLPNRLKQGARSKRRDIGIRIPEHPVAQALLAACDEVLLSTTLRAPEMDADEAPFLGHEADEVAEHWLAAVDLMLDAGHCEPGPTSIIDCTLPRPEVVR